MNGFNTNLPHHTTRNNENINHGDCSSATQWCCEMPCYSYSNTVKNLWCFIVKIAPHSFIFTTVLSWSNIFTHQKLAQNLRNDQHAYRTLLFVYFFKGGFVVESDKIHYCIDQPEEDEFPFESGFHSRKFFLTNVFLGFDLNPHLDFSKAALWSCLLWAELHKWN